jgi:hypothetical protein
MVGWHLAALDATISEIYIIAFIQVINVDQTKGNEDDFGLKRSST